jgi:hypothetical protein
MALRIIGCRLPLFLALPVLSLEAFIMHHHEVFNFPETALKFCLVVDAT